MDEPNNAASMLNIIFGIKSLDLINQSLPRLDAYRELYPTDDMVELTAKLHAKILEYLFGVYKYFQQKGWRGLRGTKARSLAI